MNVLGWGGLDQGAEPDDYLHNPDEKDMKRRGKVCALSSLMIKVCPCGREGEGEKGKRGKGGRSYRRWSREANQEAGMAKSVARKEHCLAF